MDPTISSRFIDLSNLSDEELENLRKKKSEEDRNISAKIESEQRLRELQAKEETTFGEELEIAGKRFGKGVSALGGLMFEPPTLKKAGEALQVMEPFGLGTRALGATVQMLEEDKGFVESLREQRQLGEESLIASEAGKQAARGVLPERLEGGAIEEGLGFGIDIVTDISGTLSKTANILKKGVTTLFRKATVKGSRKAIDNAFLNFRDKLSKVQRKRVKIGEPITGFAAEVEATLETLPGGQQVFQAQRVGARKEYGKLSDVVEREVTGNLNTLDQASNTLNNSINHLVKTKTASLKKKIK